VVYVVDEKVIGAIHYLTMHVDDFSVVTSCGVKYFAAVPGVPLKFCQPVIIDGINDSEFALGKGDWPDGFGAYLEKFARLEIGAGIIEADYPLGADESDPPLAGEDGTALANYIGRTKAVIATDSIFYFSHRYTQIFTDL